ncbi:MAG: hypothetical protein WAN10_06735 [Candidatus Acidiferrales bacterium]
MPDDASPSLFSVSSDEYGTLYRQHLFEQYKLYVDSADHISQRRSSTNSFLLTVNASLVTLYGLASELRASVAWHLLVPIAGILVCVAWFSLVENYRSLNSVKFQVIHALEKKLPASLYDSEWKLLEEGQGHVYKPVTHIEQWIPVVFGLLYVGLIVYSF